MLNPTVNPRQSTLLLAAHGSSRPAMDNPVRQLADSIRARAIFADVQYGFLKEAPLLGDVLASLDTKPLYVIPMLSGHGYITDELIPKVLESFQGPVYLEKPLGTLAAIPALLAERAASVIQKQKLNPEQTTVLLAAHGNARNPENARQAKAMAENIESLLEGVQATAAFIEEAPLISAWQVTTASENLIVLPFLIGGGLHGAEDVPTMLGLECGAASLEQLDEDTPFVGPLPTKGRNIWYCRSLGYEPTLADIILNLFK